LAELKSWLCLCHRQDLQHHCQVAFVNKEGGRTDKQTHTLTYILTYTHAHRERSNELKKQSESF